MNSSILTVRAVAVELARRIYMNVLIVFFIVSVIIVAAVIWLLTTSPWWWLLAIPVFSAVVIVVFALALMRAIILFVDPLQTKKQKGSVKKFVDMLQGLSEITQTPKFILLFRLLSNVARPNQAGFVQTTIGNTLSLRKDFDDLKRGFDVADQSL